MANNNSMNLDLYNIADILSRIENILNNIGGQRLSDPYTSGSRNASNVKVSDPNNLSAQEIKALGAEFKENIRGMGLGSREFTTAANKLIKEISERSKTQNISENYIERAFFAALSSWSKQGNILNWNSKQAQNNINAQQLKSILQGTITTTVNNAMQNLMNFMKGNRSEDKVLRRHFVADLVDGLGKSKFVGGAFSDLIRVGSLFLASWLNDKGPLGRALAVAVVSLGQILGPILINLVNAFIAGKIAGSLVSKSLASLGLGQASAGAAGALGASRIIGVGSAGAGTIGLGAMGTGTAAVATVGSMGAPTTGVGAVGMGAVQGVGSAGAAGIGASAAQVASTQAAKASASTGLKILGALGRIGGVLFRAASVIGWILLGIEAIVAIVKNWGKIKDWFKEAFENFGKEDENKRNMFQSIADWFTGYKPGGEVQSPDGLGVNEVGKLKVDESGAVLNARQFTQARNQREWEAYRKKDKETFDNIYEIVHQGDANLASFKNDLVMRDTDKGNKLGAVLYKGATRDLNKLRNQLKAAGISEDKVRELMYTSGRSSAGSPHTPGKESSHDNKYNITTDLGAARWNQTDWAMAMPVIKKWAAELGLNASFETQKNGTTYFGVKPEEIFGDNSHAHVAGSSKVHPTGADVNYGKAQAKKTSVGVKPPESKQEEANKQSVGNVTMKDVMTASVFSKASEEEKAAARERLNAAPTIGFKDLAPSFITGQKSASTALTGVVGVQLSGGMGMFHNN